MKAPDVWKLPCLEQLAPPGAVFFFFFFFFFFFSAFGLRTLRFWQIPFFVLMSFYGLLYVVYMNVFIILWSASGLRNLGTLGASMWLHIFNMFFPQVWGSFLGFPFNKSPTTYSGL